MNTPSFGSPYGRPVYPPLRARAGVTPFPHASQDASGLPLADVKPFIDWAECPVPPNRTPSPPADRFLKGSKDYLNWTIRMRALLGQLGEDVTLARSLRPSPSDSTGRAVYESWNAFSPRPVPQRPVCRRGVGVPRRSLRSSGRTGYPPRLARVLAAPPHQR